MGTASHVEKEGKSMKRVSMAALTCLGGTVIIWVSNVFGLWWITTLVGLMISLAIRPKWAVSVSLLVGALGWGLPLIYQSVVLAFPIMRTAAVVADLVRIGAASGALIILATLLVGALLSVSGTWVGIALRLKISGRCFRHRSGLGTVM